MVSRVIPVDPFDFVIFGGTGDLAKRKILPGLFRRFVSGQMPENAQIIGAARSAFDAVQYRALIKDAICSFDEIEATHPDLAPFLDPREGLVFKCRALHGLEYGRAGVLERDVQIRQDFAFCHQGDDLIDMGMTTAVLHGQQCHGVFQILNCITRFLVHKKCKLSELFQCLRTCRIAQI